MAYGDIGVVIDTEEFDPVWGTNITILRIAEGVVAVWSTSGASVSGMVRTYSIGTDGVIGAMVDSWNFVVTSMVGSAIHVSGNVYAVAYRGNDNKLHVKTMTIALDGTITKAAIDTLNTSLVTWISISHIIRRTGSTKYLIDWSDVLVGTNVATVNINDDGTGLALIDSWQQSASNLFPHSCYVQSDIFAVILSDGTINTFKVSSTGVITKSFVDSKNTNLVYGAVRGYLSEITTSKIAAFHISGTSMRATTFNIDSSGGIIGPLDNELLFAGITSNNPGAALAIGSKDNVAHFGVTCGEASLDDGWIIGVAIGFDGVINGVQSPVKFWSTTFGSCSPPVIVREGYLSIGMTDSPGSDGHMVIMGVNNYVDAFILEQAYSIAGVRQSIFAVAPTWTDISPELKKLYVHRGRLHEFNRVEAGTAVFDMSNISGNWWRYNTVGAHYPDVKPLTLTRLRSKWQGVVYPIFYGASESYNPVWETEGEAGFTPKMEMGCVDFFKSFTRYNLTNANPAMTSDAASGQKDVIVDSVYKLFAGQSIKIYDTSNSEVNHIASIDEATLTVTMTTNLLHAYTVANGGKLKKFPSVLSGTRLNDCLLEMSFPLALSRVDVGQCYVVEHTPPSEGTNVMEHMYAVVEAEDGLIFISADGYFTFEDAIARLSTPYDASQATFRDDGTPNLYVHPELLDDDTFIYNEAAISGDAIGVQSVVNADLQLKQGPRVFSRTKSQLASANDALDQAFVYAQRYSDSILRLDSLLLKPLADPVNLYPLVFGFDISTRITHILNSTTNPAMISRDFHIEGLTHTWEALNLLWQTKWQLWNVNKYRVFRAGKATCHVGHVSKSSIISYLDAHDAAAADTISNDQPVFWVGQSLTLSPDTFKVYRGLLGFDTNIGGGTVLEAYIIVTLAFAQIVTNAFNLVVVPPSTVDYPLISADYGTIGGQSANCGSFSLPVSNGLPQYLSLIIPLTATGIANINLSGITYFALRSSRDISSTPPGVPPALVREYVQLLGVLPAPLASVQPPRLVVRLA